MRDSGTLANPKRHRRDSFTGATTGSMTGSTSGKGDAPPTLSQSVSYAPASSAESSHAAPGVFGSGLAPRRRRDFPTDTARLVADAGTTVSASTSGASEVCLRSAKGDRMGVAMVSSIHRMAAASRGVPAADVVRGENGDLMRFLMLAALFAASSRSRLCFSASTLAKSSSACAMISSRCSTSARYSRKSPSNASFSVTKLAFFPSNARTRACAHTHSDCIFSASIFIRSALSSRSRYALFNASSCRSLPFTSASLAAFARASAAFARVSARSLSASIPRSVSFSRRIASRVAASSAPLSAFASASAHARESASTCRRKCLSSSSTAFASFSLAIASSDASASSDVDRVVVVAVVVVEAVARSSARVSHDARARETGARIGLSQNPIERATRATARVEVATKTNRRPFPSRRVGTLW